MHIDQRADHTGSGKGGSVLIGPFQSQAHGYLTTLGG